MNCKEILVRHQYYSIYWQIPHNPCEPSDSIYYKNGKADNQNHMELQGEMSNQKNLGKAEGSWRAHTFKT